jgi:hypothetical protein
MKWRLCNSGSIAVEHICTTVVGNKVGVELACACSPFSSDVSSGACIILLALHVGSHKHLMHGWCWCLGWYIHVFKPYIDSGEGWETVQDKTCMVTSDDLKVEKKSGAANFVERAQVQGSECRGCKYALICSPTSNFSLGIYYKPGYIEVTFITDAALKPADRFSKPIRTLCACVQEHVGPPPEVRMTSSIISPRVCGNAQHTLFGESRENSQSHGTRDARYRLHRMHVRTASMSSGSAGRRCRLDTL